MAMSPSAGVVYRCPLCSQRFGGRNAGPYIPMSSTDGAPLPPQPEQTLTPEIARSDPRILEHIKAHTIEEWLLKIRALEAECAALEDRIHDDNYEAKERDAKGDM